MILFTVSQYRQFYLVLVRPYENKSQNNLAFFNEIIVSVYIYCLIPITDFTSSAKVKLASSYGQLLAVAIYILSNVLYFGVMLFKQLRLKIKKQIVLY